MRVRPTSRPGVVRLQPAAVPAGPLAAPVLRAAVQAGPAAARRLALAAAAAWVEPRVLPGPGAVWLTPVETAATSRSAAGAESRHWAWVPADKNHSRRSQENHRLEGLYPQRAERACRSRQALEPLRSSSIEQNT